MKKFIFAAFSVVLVFISCLSIASTASPMPRRADVSAPSTWAATDGLGRTLVSAAQTGEIRENRYVGLFFWNWHDYLCYEDPYNNTAITNAFTTAIAGDITHPAWGLQNNVHFWDEPIYGYYRNADEWVTRKQAEALADAGVDVIFFDCTNGDKLFEYENVFRVFQKAYDDGVNVPKISFFLSYSSGVLQTEQLQALYDNIFSQGKYSDLWFIFQGKPLIIGPFWSENTELYRFFTFKTVDDNQLQAWTWTSQYPQRVARRRDSATKKYINEQISVSVARNSFTTGGMSYMSNYRDNITTRAWSPQKNQYEISENAVCYGANFADQFEYAISQDPEFIFITGWNEWNAIRYQNSTYKEENWFCDQFNYERSRDIEFSAGILKDHYYYQMVDYIRKFKGCEKTPAASEPKVIDLFSQSDEWADVEPNYVAYQGNTFDRDCGGYGDTHYYNTTGRNDIIGAKVARDSENIYFMVETAEALSPRSDDGWMRLLIDTGEGGENWESFEYIVNRQSPTNTATLERSTGGWNWESVGQIYYSINGNRLQLKIPKAMLGITGEKYTLNFKWSDNMQKDGDILDFYVNGDVAPSGRFKYSYVLS